MALTIGVVNYLKRSAILSRYGAILVGFIRLRSDVFRLIRKYKIIFDAQLSSSSEPGKAVLLAGSVGMNPDNFLQHLVGMGMRSIGADVSVLSCDGILKACFNCKFQHYQSDYLRAGLANSGPGLMCKLCQAKGSRYLKASELKQVTLSHYVSADDWLEAKEITESCSTLDDIKRCVDREVHVGQHAHAGVIRFFAAPDLEEEVDGLEVARAYLFSSILVARATACLFDSCHFDSVILDHGIYVPQGVIAELALSRGIKTTTFATGYRKHSFIFAEGGSYHYVLPDLDENILRFVTKEQRERAGAYVESRASGSNDWVLFQEAKQIVQEEEFGIVKGKKNIAIFTNVLWDAQIHFGDSIFPDSLTWLCETIEYLSASLDNNIILRIHPGEIKGFVKSRVGVEQKLRDRLSTKALRHLNIISADSPINSYELAKVVDFSVIDGSKIGIDLCALGLPVVVGGDCWTRGKGVSIDATDRDHYFANLDRALTDKKVLEVDSERARALAYFIYFDRMKAIPFISKVSGDPPFSLSSVPDGDHLLEFETLLNELQ